MKRADNEITYLGYIAIGWLILALMGAIAMIDDQHFASPPQSPQADVDPVIHQ